MQSHIYNHTCKIKHALGKLKYTELRPYSTVQAFFHQPAHPRGEGATLKRISPPRKPPAGGGGGGGGLRRIRGVSAVGFTDKNRPSELTCIQIFLVSAAGPRGDKISGRGLRIKHFPFTCT